MSDQKVLDFLKDKEPVKTLVISQHVFGPGSTKKMINKTMYALLKKGLVRKITDEGGVRPRWELV